MRAERILNGDQALGEMIDFKDLQEGQPFVCYLDKDPTTAIKASYGAGKAAGVVSFSHAAHPSMSAAIRFDPTVFTNRSVLALKDASFRTPCDLAQWHHGTPKLDRPRSVMLGTGSAIWVRTYNRLGIVDVTSGLLQQAHARPEQLWTEHWQIVINGYNGEEIVLIGAETQKTAI